MDLLHWFDQFIYDYSFTVITMINSVSKEHGSLFRHQISVYGNEEYQSLTPVYERQDYPRSKNFNTWLHSQQTGPGIHVKTVLFLNFCNIHPCIKKEREKFLKIFIPVRSFKTFTLFSFVCTVVIKMWDLHWVVMSR